MKTHLDLGRGKAQTPKGHYGAESTGGRNKDYYALLEGVTQDKSTAPETMEIYMAYEDDEGLYGLLPTEARPFDPIE